MKLTLHYGEIDDPETGDKLFKLQVGEKKYMIGIKKEDMSDAWRTGVMIRDVKWHILKFIAKELFEEDWEIINQGAHDAEN